MSLLPIDLQPPQAGDVWVRRGPPRETRHVLDRNLGGDVFFATGRWHRHAYVIRESIEKWREWEATARKR